MYFLFLFLKLSKLLLQKKKKLSKLLLSHVHRINTCLFQNRKWDLLFPRGHQERTLSVQD